MKKRYFLLVLFAFFMMPKVRALDLCTENKYLDLKAKAYRASINWEMKFDENNLHYFEVFLYNLDPDVMMVFESSTYTYTGNEKIEIVSALKGGQTYEYKFLGKTGTACSNELLITKQVKIPKYNPYSKRKECIEYEDFPMCNKWYQGVIESDHDFSYHFVKFRDSLNKTDGQVIREQSFFQKLINVYMENFVISILITIFMFALSGYYIVKKIIVRKNKIKLEVGKMR